MDQFPDEILRNHVEELLAKYPEEILAEHVEELVTLNKTAEETHG